MITPLGIKAALAEAKNKGADVYLSDDTGQRLGWRLMLRCLPSGSATWNFRYTHNGKRTPIPLGNLQSLDIQSARRIASDYAAIYNVNKDVLGKLDADKLAAQAVVDAEQAIISASKAQLAQRDKYTLSKLMELYVAYLKKQSKNTSARDVASLSKHLSPLANKPAAEITKGDLVSIQRTLLDAGKGRTANKLRSFVRTAYALVLRADSDATAPVAALDFATKGAVESNPAALLAVANGFNGTRDRVLTNNELFKLLDHTKTSGAIGLAVRSTILLGGQRTAQLLRATVDDVQDGFLFLLDPKGKREQPRKHPIPLEGMAGDVINEAVELAKLKDTKLLFSSTGKIQLSACTVSTYIAKVSAEFLESGISSTPFNLASLRATIETRLAGMGISKDARAYLQSHGLSGVQTRHYDRHDYEQEKRHALRALHNLIETRGKNTANVMPLHPIQQTATGTSG